MTPTQPSPSVTVRTGTSFGLLGVIALLAFLGGLALGWQFYRPRAAPVETPLPQVVQRDSSVILERAPDAHAKPAVLIPKGAIVERVARITVQPKPDTTWHPDTAAIRDVIEMFGDSLADGPRASVRHSIVSILGANAPLLILYDSLTAVALTVGHSLPVVTCPPVTIDLAITRDASGRHVIAKATGGTIIGGIDIPVENAAVAKTLPWAAGPMYDAGSRSYGGMVTRDTGPFRVAVGATTKTLTAGLLIRF